ncbi:Ig-like domain-containing protein [Salinisphaera dokdonensis]|uniref:Ig-like domain-containing protein n=1 Tax=Salinisphaera dokdonensis TaxID=454598 RepID=UPI00334159C3
MTVYSIRNLLLATTVAFTVAACGGSTSGSDDDGGSSGNSGGGSTPPTSGDDSSSDTPQLGSLEGNGEFSAGVISSDRSSVPAGQTATLAVVLVDGDGALLTDATSVSFTSPCASNGTAELEPEIVENTTGRISTTYTARGCDGTDIVTATTVVDGTTLRASVSLDTETAPPGSILFDGAEPNAIGIQGTGGTLPEQSTISFVVTNTTGGPVPNQQVNFSLNTQVGGIELSNNQATTDSNGRASTTVSSGTVATSVRVTAQTVNVAGQTLSAQSNALSITTGIPDNDSFTIGAETLNIEGGDRNNVTTEVTALLADRFNNPVPDGTAVSFQTEGGSIGGSCLTTDGQCSVTLRTQNPRPADGRVTVLATAIGEESFTDTNGNGRFDSSDVFPAQNDLPEAYRDDNENGARDGNEPFVDFGAGGNGDDNYSPASGSFTGALCNSGCDNASENTSLNVRDSVVVVFSGSTLNITTQPSSIDLDGGLQTVTVSVLDERGQVAPAGTTVSVEATQGSIVGDASFEQASDSSDPAQNDEAGRFVFRLEPDSEPGSGVFLITVTTPSGVISRGSAPISQDSAP